MGNGHRYFRDSTNGQLYISSIRLEDDGIWHCQYQGRQLDRPMSSKPLKLVVLGELFLDFYLLFTALTLRHFTALVQLLILLFFFCSQVHITIFFLLLINKIFQ